jgi:hypothetical protein
MDPGQKTESMARLVTDIEKGSVVLPEFQRDFVWELEKTFDLFDSFVRDIFTGSLIYGVPTFEITARELDARPRAGRGSREKLKLTSYSRTEIERLVKTTGFRLLLDGQQRATSIYRALKGIDPVYAVIYPDDELKSDIKGQPVGRRPLEATVKEIRGSPIADHVCIKVSDVYAMLNGDMPRETDKLPAFLASSLLPNTLIDDALTSPQFNTYLTQAKNIENLFRQEKLIAYYLLDTNEEKFALFFERSNSKGMQLNFIDILAAKLYAGFNLRAEIEQFERDHPSVPLNREALVRAISFVMSAGKDTGRGYILSNLTHVHFNEHWPKMATYYRRSYDYLFENRMLIHVAWMPYENMIVPLMLFVRQLHGASFAQATELQRRTLHTWYWLAIFSRRYSSGAQTVMLEDAQNLEKVGRGDFSDTVAWLKKIQPILKVPDDLYEISKQYDAVYKGVLNLVHFVSGGLVNWQAGDRLSSENFLEDHHIFPKDFLRKKLEAGDKDSQRLIDCVPNRTLIPKLQNIKISNKPPSVYLREIQVKNPRLDLALGAHMIPAELATGEYDDLYEIFLEDRAKRLLELVTTVTVVERDRLFQDLGSP